jgi:hypothetical protein
MDPEADLWHAHEAVLAELSDWRDDCHPRLGPEDDAWRLMKKGVEQEQATIWIADAKLTALEGHLLVLDDGLDICDSESSSEDHGEELEGMYAHGCESLAAARLTEEQVRQLRNQGRAEGLDTGSEAGKKGGLRR